MCLWNILRHDRENHNLHNGLRAENNQILTVLPRICIHAFLTCTCVFAKDNSFPWLAPVERHMHCLVQVRAWGFGGVLGAQGSQVTTNQQKRIWIACVIWPPVQVFLTGGNQDYRIVQIEYTENTVVWSLSHRSPPATNHKQPV